MNEQDLKELLLQARKKIFLDLMARKLHEFTLAEAAACAKRHGLQDVLVGELFSESANPKHTNSARRKRIGKEARLAKIVEIARSAGRVNRQDVVAMFGVSRPTAASHLRELCEEGLLKMHGKPGDRTSFYAPVTRESAPDKGDGQASESDNLASLVLAYAGRHDKISCAQTARAIGVNRHRLTSTFSSLCAQGKLERISERRYALLEN